jgi:hypothetical protein
MQKIIALAILALTGCAASGLERRLKDAEDENRFLRQQNAKRMQKPAGVQKPEPAPVDPYGNEGQRPPQQSVETTVQGAVTTDVQPEPMGYHCFLYRAPSYGTYFFKIVNDQSIYSMVPELDGRRIIVMRPGMTVSGYEAYPVGDGQVTVLEPGEWCYIPVEHRLNPNRTLREYVLSAAGYTASHSSNGYVKALNEEPASYSRKITTPLSGSLSINQITFRSTDFN